MPLFSLLVINSAGSILLSRYFDQGVETSALVSFERKLLRNLMFCDSNMSRKQYFVVDGRYVGLQRFGGLIMIMAGTEDTDEILLAMYLDVVRDIAKEELGNHSERSLLDSEKYGKLIMALEEFCPHGEIASTEADAVSRLAKMKA
jgi:hypothetical protein